MRKRFFCTIISMFALCLCFCLFSGACFFKPEKQKNNTNIRSVNDTDIRSIIELECNCKKFTYCDKILPSPDHTIYEELQRRKINSPLGEKLKTIEKALQSGASYRQAFFYSFPLFPAFVDKIVNEYKKEPTDSVIRFEPNSHPIFNITREQLGYEINETRLYQDIYYSLLRTPFPKIKIIPQVLTPKISALDNIKLTDLRSKFTTDFSASCENRKHNICLALSKINGLVLLPNQEFSFNKIVGRRTKSNGFLEANIILDGEYVKGTGGGVCQASTTIYNAAIRADMQITMVSNHSLISSYVPPSFDAMVNSSSSDLRFINTGETPVFIRAFGSSATATVEFYGEKLPYTIQTKSVTTFLGEVPEDNIIIDNEHKHTLDLSKGERVRVSYGHAPLKSEGYLIYYDALGREITRKLIRKDVYNSSVGLIAVAP